MNMKNSHASRRAFLGTLALGASAFTARGAFADELTRTPKTNEGPFFPTKLPLDTDNDLPDDQAGPLPRPAGCAHPLADLEGGEETAVDRVLRQGLAEQRTRRAVQADPGP